MSGQLKELILKRSTEDGASGLSSKVVGVKTLSIGQGKCRTSSDCSAAKPFCDGSKAELTSTGSYCDTTGSDVSVSLGTCTSLCEQPDIQAFLAKVQSAVKPCTDTSECSAGFTCQPLADTSSCFTYNCDAATGKISQNPCGARICSPSNLGLASARFTDSGKALHISLTAKAATWRGECTQIFDKATQALLGDAECSADGQSLIVQLGPAATVVPGSGQTLALTSTQSQLKSILDPLFTFRGSVSQISTCAACPSPVVQLQGPASVSEPCKSGSMDPISISGARSKDPTGRPLKNFQWAVKQAPAASQAYLAGILAAVNAKAALA